MRSRTEPTAPLQRRALLALPVAAAALFLWGRENEVAPGVGQVDIDAARALVAAGAVIVDVRERAKFALRHIAGAICAPVEELAVRMPAAIAALPRDIAMLVYCGDGAAYGPRGTQILNAAGYARAVNLKQGIEGWAAAGLPIA